MHRDIVWRPIALRVSLSAAIAIGVSLASLGRASSMEEATFSAEAPDRAVSDQQEMPLDAFGYLGGLFEARFYEPHPTTDDARDEIREAASLYGLDVAMMMSIAKVESNFNPRARTGSYKGLFQLSDYEFKKYGDGSIWDSRDNARAAAHMFLVQAEKFRWALGHYPDFAERYMVHQQGIQGAIEHYTHPERVAWQSMCATDEGALKGEKWCRKCIWGNLLPQWKRTFASVEKVSSGDFIALWTGRIDHLANRFSVAQGGGQPKTHARRTSTVARGIRHPRAAQLHASAAFAEPAQALATAVTRAAGSDRPQRHAGAVAH
jgi:predicted GIY-YIG superfamily endonuclease